MSDAVQPFRIQTSDDALDDLRRRLRATRWPEAEVVGDWSQGTPLAYVQDVCTYWAEKYDWGAMVTTKIAIRDNAHCAGIHLNVPIAPPDPATMSDLTPAEQSALAGMAEYGEWDSGYSKQQSTRPQTVGYGLVDSPAGQAAWIVEKFWAWTDCNGDPLNVLTRDELLDNVMLYWLPGTGASSARLYWESFATFGDG